VSCREGVKQRKKLSVIERRLDLERIRVVNPKAGSVLKSFFELEI